MRCRQTDPPKQIIVAVPNRLSEEIRKRRERQEIDAEVERLNHIRPSAEPTIQRAIDARLRELTEETRRKAL